MVIATVIHSWGDFQPIIHVSIALNAAYAALYSFVEDLFKSEIKRVEQIRDRASLEHKDHARKILTWFNRAETKILSANRNVLKPVSSFLCLVGVVLLIGSAYIGLETQISDIMALIICSLMVPFFVAILVYFLFTIIILFYSQRTRSVIQ